MITSAGSKAYPDTSINVTVMPWQVVEAQLIRKIQALHQDDPCFASDLRFECAQMCKWRRQCRKPQAVWLR